MAPPPDQAETLAPPPDPERPGPRSLAAYRLVLCWSATEPHRLGESIELIRSARSVEAVFGRGGDEPSGARPRLLLAPRRPTRGPTAGAPLDNPFVSREQLRIRVEPDALFVENVGRCPLRVGDTLVDRAMVPPGEIVELQGQLVLLCLAIPAGTAPLPSADENEEFPFGVADPQDIVGESHAMWRLRDQIRFVARRSPHVLLLGESGTGKELVARAIHALSTRAGEKLVARNAATLPPGLIDAELFGNAKNYPNAGMPERPGLFGEADRGTLFLDEVAELPVELQTHLLRVLDQDGEYQRLGDAQTRRADVRLVAATNRTIDSLREDLAARLKLRVRMPSLRERPDDIPLLVRHQLRLTAESDPEIGRKFLDEHGEPRVSANLIRTLLRHHYTTNVRELEALLWRALGASSPPIVDWTGEPGVEPDRADGVSPPPAARERELDAEVVRECLERHGWVQERVWRELGLPSRFALHRLLKKLGLRRDGEAPGS